MTARRRNPAVKRLQWIAERYPVDILMLTADALAEATGIHITFTRSHGWVGPDPILRRAQEEFPKHTRYDRYLPWLARELDRLRASYFAGAGPGTLDHRWWMWAGPGGRAQELRNRFRSVVDWAEAEKVDLNRYRYNEALDEAEAWAAVRELGDLPQGTVVYRFADDWTVQQLSTQEQLDAESAVMQHCLEDYGEGEPVTSYDGRDVWIYSLRDPKGRPHATLEWDLVDSYVSQMRGKQNDIPKPEYLERMVGFRLAHFDPFVAEVGFEKVDDPQGYDLFPKTPLLGTYSVRGAYGARPDAKLLVYAGVWDRGARAEAFLPATIDAWREMQLDEFDRRWHGIPWDPPEGMSEDEQLEWEGRARDEAWEEMLRQVDVTEEAEGDVPYRPLHWLVWRDHRALLDDNEDEMVNWLAEGGWSPTCRFLGQRAANTVPELRERLMPPRRRAW